MIAKSITINRSLTAKVHEVRRHNIYEDTITKLGRIFKKDDVLPLRIRFLGEADDDAGGPLWEFTSSLFFF